MSSTPKPGHRVRGSATGRPLMAALDLFGRRWTLRVLWELRHGPLGFRALQQECDGMSSSVLRQRLLELQEARLVERGSVESYCLTALGREASEELIGLHTWAERWAAELDTAPADHDK
ncbi:winged helix-turn-helix transcriptional regulator [Streptomyces angustmyceticus]|uniref:winged helix-turn-helix transcriptional regulator n=1 Tax=Streptomyces angustmyceticus TaxID=285578 RepID=UPI0028BF4774|nr:helix-turn-helix domain-containing protein [Streptomyces angustmyceticus]